MFFKKRNSRNWYLDFRQLRIGLSLLPLATLVFLPIQVQAQATVELAGTLDAAQGDLVRLKDPQGNVVMATVVKGRTVITYTGTANRGVLRPGSFIRFTQAAGADGMFLTPIRSVELYFPSPAVINRRASPVEMSLTHPGVYYMAAITAPEPGGSLNPDVRVVGRIVAMEGNSIALQCGDKSLKLEMDPDYHVTLNATSLEWAQSGDTIQGTAMFNPANGQLIIQGLNVQGSKPVGPLQAAAAPGGDKKPIAEKKMTAKEKAKAKKEAALAKKNQKSIKDSLPASDTLAPQPEDAAEPETAILAEPTPEEPTPEQ